MAELHITNIPDELMRRLKKRLDMKKSCGRKKGDIRKAVIEAIEMWLGSGGVKNDRR